MTGTRSLFAAALLAITAPLAIAGCGDDSSSDRSPEEVIDAAFNNDQQITSGVLDIAVDLSAGDQGSFEASLTGPFQGVEDDPAAFPQLDLTATATGEGAGQSLDFEGRLITTEDNAFVSYLGETYEVGTDQFAAFKKQLESQAEDTQAEDASTGFREGCEQAVEAQGGDPAACDFELSGWFTNLSNEGTEDLDGDDAVHVSGDVDVPQMVEDLVGIAQSVPGAEQQVDQAQIDQATEAISDAGFDIYTGPDDDLLRQLDVSVSIDPSSIEGAELVPVESIDLGFSVGVSDVNEEQTVEAPSDAKPIDELFGQLGGLGDLGGAGLGTDLGGGVGGTSPSQQEQLDCVTQAGDDPDALSECFAQ